MQRLRGYLLILLLAFIISLVRFKRVTPALRIITIILGGTLISESIAAWYTLHKGSNLFVYHFYAPLLLLAVALYYQAELPAFRKYRLGWVIGITGMFVSAANSIWLQHLNTFNDNFVLFEGVCIIAMALIAFYNMLRDETMHFLRRPCFWVSLVFLLFWCGTFLRWTLIRILRDLNMFHDLQLLYLWIWISNMLMYASLGMIFFINYKKRKHP
jgi:hypothetical protein